MHDAFGSIAPRLRITARGRAVLLAIVATPLVILALVFGLNAGGAAATLDSTSDTFTYVTVESGQSLWDIAADVAPGVDPREFAADVVPDQLVRRAAAGSAAGHPARVRGLNRSLDSRGWCPSPTFPCATTCEVRTPTVPRRIRCGTR